MRHSALNSFVSLVTFAAILTLTACGTPLERVFTRSGGVSPTDHPTLETGKAVIPAVINIQISEPSVRRFLSVTDHIVLSALGKLKPGTFVVNGRSIKIEKPTDFKLDISMPVDDPSQLSTARATGKLWTSEELVFMGMPLPRTVDIVDGKATSNVDLLRMLSAYFINVLDNQQASAKNAELRSILDVLVIKTATLQLKPGSNYYFDKKKLHIGRDSFIQLRDVALDGDLNYKGEFIVDAHFLPDCNWIGEKVDVLFNGGLAHLKLNATRINGDVKLTLVKHNANLALNDCIFKFGKNKRSQAHTDVCTMKPTEMVWSKQEGAEKSALHLVTPMLLSNTVVAVKTDTSQTDAKFPANAPAQLTVDITPEKRSNSFSTVKPEIASTAQVQINRPTTKLRLSLTKALVDKIGWTKDGELDFRISKGTANVESVFWATGKKTFLLSAKGPSTLTVPDGMSISLSKEPSKNSMELPMTIHMKSGVLTSTTTKTPLSNMNGDLQISVSPEVRVNSSMDFCIDHSKMLGNEQIQVKTEDLNIGPAAGKSTASVKKMSLTVSQNALQEALIARLPKEKLFQLNKTLEERKWRYRNLILGSVRVKNVSIDNMKALGENQMEFSISADLEATGTIDKGGLIAIIKKDAKTETLPWDVSAKVSGKGTVTYSMIPNNSLADSELEYKVSLSLPVKEDIELDWSRVNTGAFANTEKKAIIARIQESQAPIDFDGKMKIMKDNPEKWRTMKVTGLSVVPSSKGAEIRFEAETVL